MVGLASAQKIAEEAKKKEKTPEEKLAEKQTAYVLSPHKESETSIFQNPIFAILGVNSKSKEVIGKPDEVYFPAIYALNSLIKNKDQIV